MLPNSVLVISVLKDNFSEDEKKLLKDFVSWSRKTKKYKPKHWVILLTGTELFAEYHISNAWKEKGVPYSNHTDYRNTSSLQALSDSTLSIYLGLPSFFSTFSKLKNNGRA